MRAIQLSAAIANQRLALAHLETLVIGITDPGALRQIAAATTAADAVLTALRTERDAAMVREDLDRSATLAREAGIFALAPVHMPAATRPSYL